MCEGIFEGKLNNYFLISDKMKIVSVDNRECYINILIYTLATYVFLLKAICWWILGDVFVSFIMFCVAENVSFRFSYDMNIIILLIFCDH